MSKYDGLKFLKDTKARIVHTCDNCGKEIKKGEIYYPERIEMVNATCIKLKKYCFKCGKELLNSQT